MKPRRIWTYKNVFFSLTLSLSMLLKTRELSWTKLGLSRCGVLRRKKGICPCIRSTHFTHGLLSLSHVALCYWTSSTCILVLSSHPVSSMLVRFKKSDHTSPIPQPSTRETTVQIPVTCYYSSGGPHAMQRRYQVAAAAPPGRETTDSPFPD